jgi:CBS domain-containing protein
MRTLLRTTPLFALDAVVLDTETTGLDPRTARLVEIGAVALSGGRLAEEERFQSLVALDEPVPTAATAVHGVTDADLLGAPPFRVVHEALTVFIGSRPVIGHTLGFDLAMFKRECGRAGLPVPRWPTLDTRLLAQIADPSLPGFSLETLAAWLGIPIQNRHRALGDAQLTAAIFLGLVPRLRERGIRTFAEAAEACRKLTDALEDYHRAGWVEPGADLPEADRRGIERRLDSYPYRHRVRDVMATPPAHVDGGENLRAALARMVDARISSLFVGRPGALAAELGIVTERDLLRAVRARGPAALDEPVGAIASRPLVTVPAEALVYRAIGRMRRFHIRHLAVVAETGEVCGALSARDLLRLRADAAIVLGDDIDEAPDVAALACAWAKVPAMAASLLEEDVGARDIAGVIAREIGALTRRAGELAEARLVREGRGAAPCPYALMVLGSAGRGESLLALDQDHALVFARGEPDGAEDRWFAALGVEVSDILHEVGVPYCHGGVMSSNAAFRGSLTTWRDRIAQWLGRGRPEDLLNVDIVYDMRPVYGEGALASDLWRDAWAAARGQRAFLRLLGEANAAHESAFDLFGRPKREDGRIDLKRHGLRPIVANARILALRHGVGVRSTAERLAGVKALGIGGASDLEAADAIHERFLDLILRAQIADIAAGRPPSNRVPLGIVERRGGMAALKADLRLVSVLDDLARDQLS